MKKIYIIVLAACACFLSASLFSGERKASPGEVVEKVNKAADFLAEEKDAGISKFMDKNGEWVWKDTYVWILHCEKGTNAAHAIKPKLVGMQLMGIKDTNGKLFFAEFCDVANDPKGGWVEYMWPKVGEKTPSRKITYVRQVPGTPYQVAAGIYDENVSLKELKKLID